MQEWLSLERSFRLRVRLSSPRRLPGNLLWHPMGDEPVAELLYGAVLGPLRFPFGLVRWKLATTLSEIPKRFGYGYSEDVPTDLRLPGLHVVLYPNDHRPAHVHVIGNGHEAMFKLNCPDGPANLRENFGFA